MRRIPTEKQMAHLRVLGDPSLSLVSGARPYHRAETEEAREIAEKLRRMKAETMERMGFA